MGLEGASDLEVGVPDLDSSVPANADEVGLCDHFAGLLGQWTVSDAAHPVSVVVHFRGVLAVSQCVPKLDASVSSC